MKPLTLEIHGTGTHNRGAELMAIAVAERMRSSFPGARVAVSRSFGPTQARKRHGFYWTSDFAGGARSRVVRSLLRNTGPIVRNAVEFVDPRDIDMVLDASGFAFSDQWGALNAESLVARMNRPERKDQPLVLLPQALGPFNDSRVARASYELFRRAEMVCARDRQSMIAARAICDAQKLRLYPDFTLGVKPELPPSIQLPKSFCGIVPNYRMLDKTESGGKYIALLQAAIAFLDKSGLNPVFVLHDAHEDRKVIDIAGEPCAIPVIEHDDPRVLKGILGRADIVIASRFHALVSALSQGVPCVGAGWSHKYQELFSDFGTRELLLNDLSDPQRLEEILTELATAAARDRYRETLTQAGDLLRNSTERMWLEIEELIQRRING